MRIFLNERVVELTNIHPETSEGEKLVIYTTGHALVTSLIEFFQDDTIRRLIISDPTFHEPVADSLDLSSKDGRRGVPKAICDMLGSFNYIPAAGGIVKSEDGFWLFIYRNGKWDLPKGKIEKKDRDHNGFVFTTMKAALREVREETGLKSLSVLARLPETWHFFTHKKKVFLKHTYWFLLEGSGQEQLVPQISEGIELARWIPEVELSTVLENTYHSLKDLIIPMLRRKDDHRQEI
jgi:8-oxo-dGTP pyrophosphatase MutT (NUDIX family)